MLDKYGVEVIGTPIDAIERGEDRDIFKQTMEELGIDYLQGLNDRYDEWIASYKGPLLIIDGDHCKYGENPEDFRKVCDEIDQRLYGLF